MAVAQAATMREPDIIDAVEDIVKAIAEKYRYRDNEVEQNMCQTRNFTFRDGLWRYDMMNSS